MYFLGSCGYVVLFFLVISSYLIVHIQGVPKIQVNLPPFDGTGQNNAIGPNFVMPKVNRGGDRIYQNDRFDRKYQKIGYYKFSYHPNYFIRGLVGEWTKIRPRGELINFFNESNFEFNYLSLFSRFASRQADEDRNKWMSGKSPCPLCRSLFCILDVAPISHEQELPS